ncbi:unnamed protein product [Urochloa humidicola]
MHSSPHQEASPIDLAAPDAGALLPLTPDATSEVLLRLPGKSLCRLRAVCRAWRSLLFAPWFVAAHAAHNRDPYLISFHADGAECKGRVDDVLDAPLPSSWRIVRPQVQGKKDDDTVELCGRFRFLHPASGALHHLWGKLEEERAARGQPA